MRGQRGGWREPRALRREQDGESGPANGGESESKEAKEAIVEQPSTGLSRSALFSLCFRLERKTRTETIVLRLSFVHDALSLPSSDAFEHASAIRKAT